ncbi:TonB-dependent receptor domain-containing protein [Horticoccus sp. 23ND18S-11]|uniref:TonB-dependent receptor domain-containing protein n=1 Tax=Horticoccus sp. 23ND18S-11 TaxID=3391832 RepID=UPI0039C8DB34
MKPLIPDGPAAAMAACSLACALAPVQAGEVARKGYDIAGGDAAGTLGRFAEESGRQVVYLVDAVRGVTTNPVRGEYTVREALARLVADTGLVVAEDAQSGALMVNRLAAHGPSLLELQPKPKPPAMKPSRPLLAALFGLLIGSASAPLAAEAPTGTIEGRVFNAVNGNYLNNARARLDATGLEVRTNASGEFRFDRVPLGPTTITVAVSGFPAQGTQVTVVAGAPTVVNVGMSLSMNETLAGDTVVKLDSFVVASQREMNGTAIAINERRAASNLKNVIASDEFGDSPEGNVAEFLKLMPGVAIDYNAADARYVSVRGLPSFGTAVSFDGAPIASGTTSAGRETEFNQASLNNTARIEVIKSPLPDTRADSIGGSINIVSKSAFDQSRASFNYRTNVSANLSHWDGGQYYSLGRTPFSRGDNRKVLPGFDLSYIKPLSKNLGFSLSAMSSSQFTPEPVESAVWRPTQSASTLAPSNQPFLGTVTLQDGPKVIIRRSLGATVDWRATPRDVLNLGLQLNWQRATVDQNGQTFNVIGARAAAPSAYSPTFVQGASGAGSIAHAMNTFDKIAPSYTVLLKHRHAGPVWEIENGVSFSESWSRVEAERDGVIKSINLSATNLTLNYTGISNSIPRGITAQTATGAPFDWRDLGNYTITTATMDTPQENRNGTAAARMSAARTFGQQMPVRIKVGADWRRESRDVVNPTATYTFVGPDRIANTADDVAARYDLASASWSQISLPFGLGRPQRPAPDKSYALLRSHPEWWTFNEAGAISSRAANSQKITEHVVSGYLRGDLSLLQNRLKVVGGVRYEGTSDEGWGQLNDLSKTYQKDARGQIVRNANGTPVRVTTDPVALARLQFTERGSHAKRDYGDFYPSLNTSYLISEKLMVRASYARTITRPQLSSIIPSITATDPTVTTTVPTITVTNTGLSPWYSNSFDVGLEYYFDKPGVISLGAFRKDIKNFFGSVRSPVTTAQLEEWGFDSSFNNYEVVTTQNVGSARVSGLEYEYRQSLPWVPSRWGNVLLNFNSTAIHVEGGAANSISGFVPLSMNYGVTYSNARLTLRANWNVRGRTRAGQISGANVDPGTYTYAHPRRNLDFNAEFRLTRRLALFANIRNATSIAWRNEAYGPATPAYARGTRWVEYGPSALLGVKGSF